MKLEKQNSGNKSRLTQQPKCDLKNRRNVFKQPSNSDIKWFLEKVFVPIAIALIPLATTYITIQNTQQPPNPAIDRTIPPSK